MGTRGATSSAFSSSKVEVLSIVRSEWCGRDKRRAAPFCGKSLSYSRKSIFGFKRNHAETRRDAPEEKRVTDERALAPQLKEAGHVSTQISAPACRLFSLLSHKQNDQSDPRGRTEEATSASMLGVSEGQGGVRG